MPLLLLIFALEESDLVKMFHTITLLSLIIGGVEFFLQKLLPP